MKARILAGAGLILLLVAATLGWFDYHKKFANQATAAQPLPQPVPTQTPTAQETKIPPPGAIKAPKELAESWRDMKRLQDELTELTKKDGIQQRSDQLQGLILRLTASIPKGYTFDEESMSFVPQLPLPQPLPQPPPKK